MLEKRTTVTTLLTPGRTRAVALLAATVAGRDISLANALSRAREAVLASTAARKGKLEA